MKNNWQEKQFATDSLSYKVVATVSCIKFVRNEKERGERIEWDGNAVIEWLYQFNYSIIDRNWGIKIYT